MQLIKDIHNDRIVYYWADDNLARLSPMLASLKLAEEWRNQHLHDTYQGRDRRHSAIDRRRYQHKRDQHALHRGNFSSLQSGRRQTDQTVKVDIDLATEKLAQIFDQARETGTNN